MARRSKKESDRMHRIEAEIIVDCYGPDEQAIGWYCYLEDRLHTPFAARCIAKRAISPLKVGDDVEAIGMPSESECKHEMFVTIRWEEDGLAIPLFQLKPHKSADQSTRQAVEDWHYWVEEGYEL